MKQPKTTEKELFNWCLGVAAARYTGKLTQEKLEQLQSIDFPWAYYENELDKLGFDWEKNNPNGVRWCD